MKKYWLIPAFFIVLSCSMEQSGYYDSVFPEDRIEHIAYPIGGLGSGMFAIEGTGAISHMSLHHQPDLFNEPCMFAAIHVDGLENGTKVVEAPVPDYKKYGRRDCGQGLPNTTYGLPHFTHGEFIARFPFANTSKSELSAVFSYNSRNIMYCTDDAEAQTYAMPCGAVFNQTAPAGRPQLESHFAIFAPEDDPSVDCCWFRSGWWDPMRMAWKKVATGDTTPVEASVDSPGASLYVPFTLGPGQSRTIKVMMAWYVPVSDVRHGEPAAVASDFGDCYSPELYRDMPQTYVPWYARAMSSYSMLQALTGVRYDAVDQALYIDSRVGDDFRTFLAVDGGYATVGMKAGKPFIEVRSGNIPVEHCYVSGVEIQI